MKIHVFTYARSEYSYLRNVFKAIESVGVDYTIWVGGTHLASSHGRTIWEIEEEFPNNIKKISYQMDGDTPALLVKGVGLALISIASMWENVRIPDYIIILGDRHELYSAAITALLHKVPIIHLSGGEVTQGAIDEQVRHSITKMSHIHIVSTYDYAENISRMGEEDWRIHVLGAAGIENIYNIDWMAPDELAEDLGIDPSKPTLVVTYHPVTLDFSSPREQIENLIHALEKFDFQVVFTAPGAETGRNEIYHIIDDSVKKHSNWFLFDSLGVRRYLSLVKVSKGVVGNSSSGIIEVPSLGIPTLNIGDRQKGRVSADSVIHVGYSTDEIERGLKKLLSDNFQQFAKRVKNPYDPYGDGRFSERFARLIANLPADNAGKEKILRKRLVFDVEREEWNFFLKGGVL